MSSETKRGSRLRVIIAISLVAVVVLGAGYYFAAGASPPVVEWSVSPLKINISPTGHGSASDSFTCSRKISPVTVTAQSFAPDIVTLTVTPNAFSDCGSTPDTIQVSATCNPSVTIDKCVAQQPAGTVTVCGPSPYTCLKKPVQVVLQAKKGPIPTSGTA